MARRQAHEEHQNHEAWAIPYGDLITLLLAFFVVMYAVSSVNEGKYRVLSPEQCIAAGQDGEGVFVLHPLCGGLPPERGWECLHLYVEQVLPALAG